MKPRIYYCARPEDGFGWGVCNTNLALALEEFCDVRIDAESKSFDAPAFIPIADSNLTPLRKIRGPRVIGYCFTEFPIGDKARVNSRQYDVLFAGSNWNVQRLAEHGITSTVLHQGIDFERFKVQPPSARNGFVVFSGGKYEFRKGQDYVAAAMKHFMHVHGDVVLLAAWHNQWPASRVSMSKSWLIDWENPFEGLPRDRVFELPPMPNERTPDIYAQAHVGLFPNRCEAGTNLVLCEFMACGRPIIATNATGHADVFSGMNDAASLISNGTYDAAGWFNPNVSDIITRLEFAYQNRAPLIQRAQEARRAAERFTWRACALQVARSAFPGRVFLQPDLESESLPAAVPVH